MDDTATITATEFKAKCLDLLDQLADRRLTRLQITKRGQVVAVVTSPEDREDTVRAMLGAMQGSVVVPKGFDLTAPVLDDPFEAESGSLHG